MTNYEKYIDLISECLANAYGIGFFTETSEPFNCMGGEDCEDCKFYLEHKCSLDSSEMKKWLTAECIERPKLTKRERAFCEEVEG